MNYCRGAEYLANYDEFMSSDDSVVMGSVYYFGEMEDLAQMLAEAGLAVRVGHWALRIDQFARAFILGFVGHLSPDAPFNVQGDGYNFCLEALADNCRRLADCLRRNGIGFDFMHVTGDQEQVLGTYEFLP